MTTVHIPVWLLKMPKKKLSYSAKILYGRLAYWSNEEGIASRTLKELSSEIGMKPRSITRIIKELKDLELIISYKKELGGKNYYKFLKHPMMF